MSVEELDKTKKPSFEKKAKRPSKWAVVLKLSDDELVPCHLCVLRRIFNFGSIEAIGHLQRAARNGNSVVLETHKDIAETKADDGNKETQAMAQSCHSHARSMHFSAEPLS